MSGALAYYNENDPQAAAWLRCLIVEGLIAPGDVDDRSIEDVAPSDLEHYTQCHFFAGIGGWSYALRLAGWPDDRPVWTGSCPCQPFSAAGKRKGAADDRHLWPAFWWLIAQCEPPVVFGEQVASKSGREWLAGVQADLETLGYRTAAADLCAAGVGAPHIRQRLWWLGDSSGAGGRGHSGAVSGPEGEGEGSYSRVDDPDSQRLERERVRILSGPKGQDRPEAAWAGAVYVPCADGKARRIKPGIEPLVDGLPGSVGLLRGYGNAIVPQVAAAFVRAYGYAACI